MREVCAWRKEVYNDSQYFLTLKITKSMYVKGIFGMYRLSRYGLHKNPNLGGICSTFFKGIFDKQLHFFNKASPPIQIMSWNVNLRWIHIQKMSTTTNEKERWYQSILVDHLDISANKLLGLWKDYRFKSLFLKATWNYFSKHIIWFISRRLHKNKFLMVTWNNIFILRVINMTQ